jgi:hypothetical protein
MVKKKGNEFSEIRGIIIDTMIDAEEAKLRALKRLRREPGVSRRIRKVGRSQVDYVEAILRQSGNELHINEIITRIQAEFDVHLDRESIVSALTKRVQRRDRFMRTGRNTFALREEVL